MPLTPFSDQQPFLDVIVDGIQNVKGHDISVLNLTQLPSRCSDFFVICEAESHVQVSAIAYSIIDGMRSIHEEYPIQKEGLNNGQWVLLDYGSVIVHVFQKEWRQHYDIEGLWSDAEIHEIQDIY